jgi:hypothetical protein
MTWQDYDVLTRRALEDAFANELPTTLKVGAKGWLEALIGATEQIAQGQAISTRGGPGWLAATRTSDTGTAGEGAQGAWALGSFAVNNNTQAVQTAYGHYIEVRRYSGAGVTEGLEVAVINRGDVKQGSPHNWSQDGATIGLLLGAGRGDVVPNANPTTGIVFAGGGAKWQTGIVFGEGSIATNGAYPGIPVAIDMQRGYSLLWRDLNDTPAGYIRSDVSNSPNYQGAGGIIFTDSGVQLDSAAGAAAAALNNTGFIINGTLNVTNAATLQGTFSASGPAVFGNTINASASGHVFGSATFNGSLGINGPLVAGSSLGVNGTSDFALGAVFHSTLGVSGTTTLSAVGITGALGVGGPVSFTSTLSVMGASTLTGVVGHVARATFGAAFDVAGRPKFNPSDLGSYANDAAAGTAGLTTGMMYTVAASNPLQLAIKT